MKKILFIFLLAAIALSVSGQKLADIYKKGTVKLVPDPAYAQNNNWEDIFKTYYDTVNGKPIINRKSLKIMPDGSVIVNNANRNYYTKFSPDGRFEKEFGIKNSEGVQFKKINFIEGVINSNTFFSGLDNMGNMICFDFNGKYVKTLKLDYMARQMISMPDGKIAVVGWVIWKNKFRDFVSIVDYETNQEKVVWENFTDRPEAPGKSTPFTYYYKFENKGIISCTTIPFSKSTSISSSPDIAFIGDKLVVAVPSTGEVLVYDPDGKLISKDKIEGAVNYLSVDEQKDIQRRAIERFRKIEYVLGESNEEKKTALQSMIKEMEADMGKISEPMPLPVFSTVLSDSDGNLLFFEYPKEENANKFSVWIYENGGKFICQSSFVCDDYDLVINPSKMVFHNGYIYGLQTLKVSVGMPLRLVRFKIANN